MKSKKQKKICEDFLLLGNRKNLPITIQNAKGIRKNTDKSLYI